MRNRGGERQKEQHPYHRERPRRMVAGEGGVRWMREKQMDVVIDEWTWLEKKMLKREVQERG